MNYSVREFRHIAGRFLHAHGCAPHLANPLRELLLSAQAEGFDAFAELERTRAEIRDTTGALVEGPSGVLDACGQAAFAVAPDLVDRLVVACAAADDGRATLLVAGTSGAEVVAHLRGYAWVRGVVLDEVATEGDRVRVTATAAERPADLAARDQDGPALAGALVAGFDADVAQFWRLFHESNDALTPDSELSRQHAGAQVRDEDGNVIGEVDEESYLYIRSQAEEVGAR